jgi:hypothetical protein
MHTNKAQLHYDDHEQCSKLLDQRVWEVKVSTITKTPKYETLTMNELFSKLKSTEIDHQTRAKVEKLGVHTMALVSGGGPSSANPSPLFFTLSSLLSISEE